MKPLPLNIIKCRLNKNNLQFTENKIIYRFKEDGHGGHEIGIYQTQRADFIALSVEEANEILNKEPAI